MIVHAPGNGARNCRRKSRGVDELRDATLQSVEGPPDEIHFRLELRQSLKLHVLIVAKIVQNLPAFIQEGNDSIEFGASDVDPACGRDSLDRPHAPSLSFLGHEDGAVIVDGDTFRVNSGCFEI